MKTGNSCREALDFQDKSEREKMKIQGNRERENKAADEWSTLHALTWTTVGPAP